MYVIKLLTMKDFKVGDSVAVLDDVLKGVVTQVSIKSVTIRTADGFLMNFAPHELVKIVQEQKELSKYSDVQLEQLLHEKKVEVKKKRLAKSVATDKLPVMEVDLHIHQLIPSTKGLSNYELLTIQLNEAERTIRFAKSKKIQRVVFIHGVGEGVLQQELYSVFQKHQVDYYAASYQKYGMGATEIYIYQNLKTSL